MNYKEEIKAVVFDFDGTLVDFNQKTTEYTINALRLLKQNNYIICLSSGRPCFLAMKAYEKYFDVELDYVFGCNGAEMLDVKNNKTDILFPLDEKDIGNIAKIIDCDFLVLGIYEGSDFLVNRICESEDYKKWLADRWLTPILYDFSSNDKKRSKVLVINSKADRTREEEYINSIDLSAYSYAYSSPMCLEIAPKGVSKAKSIELLSDILKCDKKQILSFGDMQNDLPMLLNSTGVVMDNASDEMKSQISLHTSAVDKLGVYEFLHNNQLI